MAIDTKQQIVDLKGRVIVETTSSEPLTVGFVLANIILSPGKDGFPPLRAYELAMKFTNQDQVELDGSELSKIKEIVEKTDVAYPLVIAQILQALNK